jgi:disulfide oxidoreductase YuzD
MMHMTISTSVSVEVTERRVVVESKFEGMSWIRATLKRKFSQRPFSLMREFEPAQEDIILRYWNRVCLSLRVSVQCIGWRRIDWRKSTRS